MVLTKPSPGPVRRRPSEVIRLLVADDHPIVREGLKRIVGKNTDMQVIGEAVDSNQVLAQVKTTSADVLLLDISMPGPGFLETLGRLRTERSDLPILVLSVHPEDHYAVRALQAGAAGYLTKDRSPENLAAAIRQVYEGKRYISSTLAERLVSRLDPGADNTPHEVLSDREYQVLCKLGAGKSITEIAFDLVLSPKTISTFRSRILKKLELKTTAQLVRYAVTNELFD